jgi:hypothetical protein
MNANRRFEAFEQEHFGRQPVGETPNIAMCAILFVMFQFSRVAVNGGVRG